MGDSFRQAVPDVRYDNRIFTRRRLTFRGIDKGSTLWNAVVGSDGDDLLDHASRGSDGIWFGEAGTRNAQTRGGLGAAWGTHRRVAVQSRDMERLSLTH